MPQEAPPSPPEALSQDVGGRARRGVGFLVLRYGVVQAAGLAANITLAHLLDPEAFGFYAVALVVIVVLNFLSEFGLGAALLQRRAPLDDVALGTLFTTQQAAAAAIGLLFILVAPAVNAHLAIGPAGVGILRLTTVAAFIAVLRTAPTILLERRLSYGRVAAIEMIEVLVFQLSAVLAAIAGLGVASFVVALLVSRAAGTTSAFVLARWRPRLAFSRAVLAETWAFGLNFQLGWLTFVFRDYLVAIAGAVLLLPAELGYLNWALAFAGVPGQLAQAVGRVGMPALARLHHDPLRFKRAGERMVRALFLTAVPLHLFTIAASTWVIPLVFSAKWWPALGPLCLFSIHWAGASITTPTAAMLNAAGRPRLTLTFSTAWTVLLVALALPLHARLGYAGIAAAYAIAMIFASAAAAVLAARIAGADTLGQIRGPMLAALVAGGAVLGFTHAMAPSLLRLALAAALMAGGMVLVLYLAEGRRLILEVREAARFLGAMRRAA